MAMQLAEIEPFAVDLPEAARLVGLSQKKVWLLARAGDLPSCKIGTRRKFVRTHLRDWLEQQVARMASCE